MPIAIACPSCYVRLRVADEFVGRKVRCPKCSGVIAVSESPDEVETGVTAKASMPAGGNGVAGVAPRRAPLTAYDEQPRIRRESVPVDDDEDFEEPRPRKKKKKKKQNNGLVIGLFAGGGFLLLAIIVLVIILVTANKQDTRRDGPGAGGPNNPAAPVALAGTTWVGHETLQGYGRLEFRFVNENQVTMVDAKETVPGTYNRNGNQITMTFFGGEVVYIGVLAGQTMSGTASNPGKTWTWNVKR